MKTWRVPALPPMPPVVEDDKHFGLYGCCCCGCHCRCLCCCFCEEVTNLVNFAPLHTTTSFIFEVRTPSLLLIVLSRSCVAVVYDPAERCEKTRYPRILHVHCEVQHKSDLPAQVGSFVHRSPPNIPFLNCDSRLVSSFRESVVKRGQFLGTSLRESVSSSVVLLLFS